MPQPEAGSGTTRAHFFSRPSRVFTSNFTGISNRLEGLPLSFAISERYGHEVCLDWPEFEALEIRGVMKKKMRWLDRIGGLVIEECDESLFEKLGGYRTIIQRAIYAPTRISDRYYLETAQRLRLQPGYASVIAETFSKYRNRPVVGVHIRRGDFVLVDPETYDESRKLHQAIPLWWHEAVMRQIAQSFPDVAFFLSCTGDSSEFRPLKAQFDIFELPLQSPYTPTRKLHYSVGHPVADLFALACCNLIIATPNSSFSHYAANALGSPSTAIIPPTQTARQNPQFGYVRLYGKPLPSWVGVSTRPDFVEVTGAGLLPAPTPPSTDWLQGARP